MRAASVGILLSSLVAGVAPATPASAEAQSLRSLGTRNNTVTMVAFEDLRTDPDRWDGRVVAVRGVCDRFQDRGWLFESGAQRPPSDGELVPGSSLGLRRQGQIVGCGAAADPCPDAEADPDAEACDPRRWAVGVFRAMDFHLGELELTRELVAELPGTGGEGSDPEMPR